MRSKGCGPHNLGSPIKQLKKPLTHEQIRQRQERVAQQRLSRRQEQRERRNSRA
jgi:hypothetical protein